MATWNTPAGSLGERTQGQPLSITVQASPSLGGVIQYQLYQSTLPQGLSLNSYTGVISGTSTYVDVATVYSFTINANEITSTGTTSAPRAFSITVNNTQWVTSAGDQGTYIENTVINKQFSATPSVSGNTIKYTLLNGSFPAGTLTLGQNTGILSGLLSLVDIDVTSEFTLRAIEYNGLTAVAFRDRTFTMTVNGPSIPQFITPAGALFTVYDSTWRPFQIEYQENDPTVIPTIRLVLGTLPPGLEINETGLIRGYALPPVDSSGNQVSSLSYPFTLEVSSTNGSSQRQYSIIVNNQSFISGFVGRNPVILNNQPQSLIVLPTDPYYGYYFTESNIGSFVQSTNFVFKFIGYNFDSQDNSDLQYEVVGLSQAINNLNSNVSTGWQTGTVATIGETVNTYNITARVFKSSNPSLTSDTFLFSITIVGDISLAITWLTDGNLATIKNGTVSDLSVVAESTEGIELNYRIIGNQFESILRTIISTGNGQPFLSFGDNGESVTGSSNGNTWTPNLTVIPTFNNYYFKAAVYDSVNSHAIVVGVDEFNNGIVIQITASPFNWINLAIPACQSLNDIIFDGTRYITVGNNGVLIKTNNPASWTNITNTGTTRNINSICFTGAAYALAGDQGLILTSANLVTFTRVTTSTTANLNSITWTGTRFVAVGDIGTILTSTDGILWAPTSSFNDNFNSVFFEATTDTVIVVGQGGVIIRAQETGNPATALNFFVVSNLVTANDLYDIIFQSTVGQVSTYLIVGSYGTVLKLNINLNANTTDITSTTLGKLPPNLYFNSFGEFVGRLAFESTSSLDPIGTTNQYAVRIQAYSPTISQIYSNKTFTLTTYQEFQYPWDTVYMKLLSSQATRDILADLLNDSDIIDPAILYRPTDPYFGKATNVVYDLFYGIPSVGIRNTSNNLTENWFPTYINAMAKNFYWRNITLGPIKTAVAIDTTGTVIYEVVYSEIIDDLINPQGQSINKQIIWPRTIITDNSNFWTSTIEILSSATYYDKFPAVKNIVSVTSTTVIVLDNVDGLSQFMNVTVPGHNLDAVPPTITAINTSTNTITLSGLLPVTVAATDQLVFSDPVFTSIETLPNRDLYPNSTVNMRQQLINQIGQVNNPAVLPRWMTSQQLDGNTLGYVPAWVICYTKPGPADGPSYAEQVKINIETQWPYVLNQINFQLDRIEVDRSLTYNYVGTGNAVPVWTALPSAEPFPQPENAEDQYVYFPQKNILSTSII
jgi:photosystem II stability/assembly factor-like uncharacterized protein